MMLTKFSNAYRMVLKRGWREALIRLDQLIHTSYFDFSVCQTNDIGLDPLRSNAHRGSASDVSHVLSQLALLPKSSIIDVGSGKGRAMIAMAHFPFEKITGVEISPKLASIARRNLARAFLANRSEIVTSCASVFDAYDSFNYFYFYNPFPIVVLREVVGHISASLKRRPRNCWLIYSASHSTDVEEVICEKDLFRKVSEYRPPGRKSTVVYCHQPHQQIVNVV